MTLPLKAAAIMDMADIVLYNYFRSSTSYRVRAVLHHKGLEFQYRAVHLLKDGGEQHSEEFRRLNPQGEVPTLIHDGKIISQSVAIIEYLDEVFPNPPIFPKNPALRAQVRQFNENINSFNKKFKTFEDKIEDETCLLYT
ncbi:MAG: glutathione S-transferase N-terminal domain-containing protein, partial [Bdellovibrionaceae bacterium]|nr:glutathione S-transferase N-terminal domain-containing protein [Pseudobdellovibrionaceae bacterium]